jgi:hypothetical protein
MGKDERITEVNELLNLEVHCIFGPYEVQSEIQTARDGMRETRTRQQREICKADVVQQEFNM